MARRRILFILFPPLFACLSVLLFWTFPFVFAVVVLSPLARRRLDHLPHAPAHRRHGELVHAERRQRVQNGDHDRREGADRACLTDVVG
jgi:hypothetical protein